MMNHQSIRQNFLDFFQKRDHQLVTSSSLVPADPTVLFTSAGMQQFIPYLSGQAEPPYCRATSVQKCFRTSDIDQVGDESHHTFFEMLGNWSFGDPEEPDGIGAGYFKKEAIDFALELLIKHYKLPKEKLWITVFKGEKSVPKDEEAIKYWQAAGIPREKIKEFGMKDNFWGPVGPSGPCGPCSEIHYDRGEESSTKGGSVSGEKSCDIKNCGPNCSCGRFVEIWNLVFMEYNKVQDGQFEQLPAKNIDTGAGLERIAAILQNKKSNFETDLFLPIIKKIEETAQKSYSENGRAYRIIADHIRGACFLIADGVLPSKEDRGYILRRILRRAMRYGKLIDCPKNFLIPIAQTVIDNYHQIYPEIRSKQTDILTIIQNEEEKFSKTLNQGLKKFKKLISRITTNVIPAEEVFHLYDTYGFPFELTKEMAEEKELKISEEDFKKAFKKHQEISRAGVKKKFGGVGEWGEKVAPQHTATHLLQAALRQVLGQQVHQAGSDLTPERLRFDFTHPTKLTDQEIKKVEEIINQKIKENLSVKMEEMPYEKAIKTGALAFFKEKYPRVVKVYTIGDPSAGSGSAFSQEVCAGPHVKQTREIGEFKIIKSETAGDGVQRIKATVGRK